MIEGVVFRLRPSMELHKSCVVSDGGKPGQELPSSMDNVFVYLGRRSVVSTRN